MLVQEVEDHIYVDGFNPDYVNLPWVEHGEKLPELPALNVARPFKPHQPISVGDIPDMLQDAFGLHDNEHFPDIEVEDLANHDSIPTPDAAKFYKLMSEADMELFPGARKKKIDFLIRYYQLKDLHGWSDVSFTESLKLLNESFPEGENLPDSFYKTKQLVKDLGLSYEKIDACPNDCMLYWKEHSEATSCSICGTSSRYIKGAAEDGTSAKKIAAKVLRSFPLGPRLQRLYMSRHTTESMIWHSTKRPRDGFLRHLADSPAWSKVDELYPNFGNESRNVRLGLASDGFNPFGNIIVLWTISDFPAYAMLFGYSTKGYKACPVCMEETDSIRLHHGNKECFLGHQRWLTIEHRYQRWRNSFNGLPEHRGRPTVMSGTDCLRALSGLRFQFGKGKIPAGVRKRSRSSTLQQEPVKGNWRKKNSVVGTLLGMKWKNKDSAKAHEDMVLLNVKKGLHPKSPGGRYPPAIFNLKNMEKTTNCSNISNCVRVEEMTLVGLKSHDNHILMQHLLPVAIRRAISSICTLEAIMPPAFFDVMEHLPIHLADEAAIACPVQYR
ncbi:uncharacterized protein LOC133711482 [Rosa rugosa]|uniref:uncharacterized protein LOC133711482 n=1 Tax=Rosa rugosa TaxID=74645 RepID=UPI002B40D4DF|nr:uncharacterized protein LOC133711482 [Rosa rugosa]